MTDKIAKPTQGALAEAEAAFECIRLILVNRLEEPERSAFWKAVEARDAIRAVQSTTLAQKSVESLTEACRAHVAETALREIRRYCDENLGPSRSSLLAKIAHTADVALELAAQPPAAPVETKCDCLPWPDKCPYCGGDAPVRRLSAGNGDLETIYAALDQAQDCIRGETPEDVSDQEAREDTIDKVRDAMRLVEHMQAQPQQFEVTDEMVLEGAKAMVRAGQERRAKGQDLPTRLQESRACLDAALSLSRPQLGSNASSPAEVAPSPRLPE